MFLLFFLEWEVFQSNVSGKIKTVHVKWFFPRKSCWLWDNVDNVVERDRPQMASTCVLYAG